MDFGTWLRGKRQKHGLSMVEFGAMVGVSDVQISRIETGKRRPAYETALRIALALGEDDQRVLRMAGYEPVEMANAGE